MIKSKQDYKEYLDADKFALKRKGIRAWLFVLDPIWCYQQLLRKCEYYRNCKKSLPCKMYLFYLRFRLKLMSLITGFFIPLNAVGPGLCIVHIGPILIANNVTIGRNLRISIGVVIGEKMGSDNIPQIGDDVILEPGSKIFGKIHIANGIHVGANSVVNKSFTEEGVIIAGVPARKIKDNPNYHCQ